MRVLAILALAGFATSALAADLPPPGDNEAAMAEVQAQLAGMSARLIADAVRIAQLERENAKLKADAAKPAEPAKP